MPAVAEIAVILIAESVAAYTPRELFVFAYVAELTVGLIESGTVSVFVILVVPRLVFPLNVSHVSVNIPDVALGTWLANDVDGVNEIEVEEDAYIFEKLHNDAAQETDPARRLECYLKACYQYGGEFLPMQSGNIWAVRESMRYEEMFADCVEQAGNILRQIQDFNRMKELGLAKGDTEEAVNAGAHAMFLPHGLGHMMGMDVHDMENLDQINVGFDEEVRPNLEQFGTNCLRMGRRLQEGFVVTDEPGIYFIPALIDEWRTKKHCADFLNFDELEKYKDFGGIRIEDDVLITKDGCRFIGKDRIPYHPQDVEDFMSNN